MVRLARRTIIFVGLLAAMHALAALPAWAEPASAPSASTPASTPTASAPSTAASHTQPSSAPAGGHGTDVFAQIGRFFRHVVEEHSEWAYLLLFVLTFLEGETVLIIAAVAARHGLLNLQLCILAAFLGSFGGDECAFFIGRWKGNRVIARWPKWQPRVEKVYRLLERHHTWIILGFRFMYGLRNVTPFALGMSNVTTKRFVLLNAMGAAVWALSYALIGYLVGSAIERAMEGVEHYKGLVLAVAIGVALLIWLGRMTIRRIRAKKQDAQPTSADAAPGERTDEFNPPPPEST